MNNRGKYFSVAELTRSRVAQEKHIDNTPPSGVKMKLESLISNLLDPIRELWGSPIVINSGYRSPVLNKMIGGVPTSQHIRGEAADISVGGSVQNKKLFQAIISSGLPFDQLIDEKNYTWLHVSWSANNRKQTLHL